VDWEKHKMFYGLVKPSQGHVLFRNSLVLTFVITQQIIDIIISIVCNHTFHNQQLVS
jgi:hypothetical protein